MHTAAKQAPEMTGPAYFTTEWDEVRDSRRTLADLEPELLVSGHGASMTGTRRRAALRRLARGFDDLVRPRGSRYDGQQVRPRSGASR